MISPPQISGKLHVLEFPSLDDIQNVISNEREPENVKMLVYWLRKIQERASLLGTLEPFYEDAIFLGCIEWMWFLKELSLDRLRTC